MDENINLPISALNVHESPEFVRFLGNVAEEHDGDTAVGHISGLWLVIFEIAFI